MVKESKSKSDTIQEKKVIFQQTIRMYNFFIKLLVFSNVEVHP